MTQLASSYRRIKYSLSTVIRSLVVRLFLHILEILHLAGIPSDRELFHHFEEFDAVILEQVVGNGKDASLI